MATSKLQRKVGNMLDKALPQFRIRENYRPDWLISSNDTWLELDFYIEEIKVAFEIQGMQHFEFVPFFHKTREEFEMRRKHDQEKRDLCYGNGVKLIEICTETDAQVAIINVIESNGTKEQLYQLSCARERQENARLAQIAAQKKQVRQARNKRRNEVRNLKRQKESEKMNKKPLPGSHKMRNRARNVLTCSNIGGYMWEVLGGRESHSVKYVNKKIYKCDCAPYLRNDVSICSHIIKVMMSVGDFPQEGTL